MGLIVNPVIAQRWVKDHFERFRVGAEDENILRLQDCPSCGHRKWAVRFNCITQKLTCFRCQQQLSLFDLVKLQRGLTRMQDVYSHLKSYGELNFTWGKREGLDRLKAFKEILQQSQALPAVDQKGQMDLASFSTDWQTQVGQAVYSYGLGRNIPDLLLASGRIGYFRRGALVGRLAFLVYENGQPVFTVGRAIRSEVRPKYLYPEPSFCGGRVATDVLYNIDAVRPGDTVPVAEGILSAISADAKAQAMLGNMLSTRQAEKLAAKQPAAVILLREDGIAPYHAEESADRLRRKGVDVFIADLIDGDPNDNPGQMPQVLASARPCDRLSKLKAMRQDFS